MKEEVLHFIWEQGYYEKHDLKTVSGNELEIISAGSYNKRDAGPDFTAGEIFLDGIKWIGQIEIHYKSSDWMKHRHHEDSAYANVILHVVYEHDRDIFNQEGEQIPTLELGERIPIGLISKMENLFNRSDFIPCHNTIHSLSKLQIHQWLDRLAVDRLTEKAEEVFKQLESNSGDWEATYIDTLCAAMGFKVNKEAFLMLSQIIDWRWIQKNAADIGKLEAYFYGLAGFLMQKPRDNHEAKLIKEFTYLKSLLDLKALPLVVWKFSRMRPSNYPTLRIAQLVSLFHKHTQLFPSMLYCTEKADFYKYFETEYPDYWQRHYAIGKQSKRARKKPGKMSVQLLLINVISPVLYAYGNYIGKDTYTQRAINLWQSLQAEKNRITRAWEKVNVNAESAWDSQALIHLHKRYCREKKCLQCQIGRALLREAVVEYLPVG